MNLPITKDGAIKAAEWMRKNFGDKISDVIKSTPIPESLVYAIACQETAVKWLLWIDDYPADIVLARCVFDASGDYPGTTRRVFPRTHDEFREKYGDDLLQMLIDEGNKQRAMPQPGYPNGWHKPANYLYKGYSIFQYDLQNIQWDEAFFRKKLWYSFDACIGRLITMLLLKYSRHRDLWKTVMAYNGSGKAAQQYMANVKQFNEWVS